MRIRTIKPEFWRNRKLASLGREVHDLAARLISESDDEGYLSADIALLAGDLYPFDGDAQRFIKRSLPALQRIGFIEIRGGEFGIGFLPGFKEHQRINRPTPSRLRPRFEQATVNAQLSEGSLSAHGAISEPSPTEVEREREEEQGSGTGIVEAGAPDKLASLTPAADDLQRAWNAEADTRLPRCAKLTDARRKGADARLREHGLPKLREVIQRINASDFCRGLNRPEPNPWVATFDWLVTPDAAVKVLEGKYDNRAGSGQPAKGAAWTQSQPNSSKGFAEGLES